MLFGPYTVRSRIHSSGWAFFLCECLFAFELNVFWQYVQVYKMSPVCDAMCSFSESCFLNALSHNVHLKIASLKCTFRMWFRRALLFGDILPQYEHDSGDWLCDRIMWHRKLCTFLSLKYDKNFYNFSALILMVLKLPCSTLWALHFRCHFTGMLLSMFLVLLFIIVHFSTNVTNMTISMLMDSSNVTFQNRVKSKPVNQKHVLTDNTTTRIIKYLPFSTFIAHVSFFLWNMN